MRLDEYDRVYSSLKMKSSKKREKEKEFEHFLFQVCCLAKKYHFNVWEGRSKNPFSVTVSQILDKDRQINVSIKYCKDLRYRGCFTNEWNPNRNHVSDYNIDFSSSFDVLTFLENEMIQFTNKYGLSNYQDYVFTVNPFFKKI